MKRASSLITLLSASFLLMTGCGEETAEGGEAGGVTTEGVVVDAGIDDPLATVTNVRVMTIEPETFDDVVNIIGTVKPAEDIRVASEEGGKVERWYISKGAYVKKGTRLLSMNDDMLQAQLESALAQEKIARLNAEKYAQVYAEAGAVPELTVTTAQYNLEAASAQVKLLKTRINKMTVRAPVSGRIEERMIDVGEMVGPGSPIARLLQSGTIKVSAGVPERYVRGLRVGLPVKMTFDALGGRVVNGTISYVGSTIDPNDRTLTIEIQLSNGGEYKPEMVAEIEVVRSRLRNSIVVPRTALIRVENGYQVYVAVDGPDGTFVAESRDVTIGASDRGVVVVTDGLRVGETIIVVGQNKVNPGETIEFEV